MRQLFSISNQYEKNGKNCYKFKRVFKTYKPDAIVQTFLDLDLNKSNI